MSTTSTTFKPSKAGENLPPLPHPAIPLRTQVLYWLQLCTLKIVSTFGLKLMRLLVPGLKNYRPTFTKKYPCRPSLENRVFIPKGHKVGDALPLYLDIHGGGFAVCDPEFDDEFCHVFANRFHMLVVSLNYSKSPSVAFPIATYDVAAIARAVIDDGDLPVDKARVAIGGFSAGGNLALSAAQLPELKGKIIAAVTYYPVLDFAKSTAEKLQQRPYKKLGETDMLKRMGLWFNYGYLKEGQDRRDPLLSPTFAMKEDLPPWIFNVAAEYDMLAREARDMIYALTETENPSEDEEYSLENGTYKWRLVKDVKHGFTHGMLGGGKAEQQRVKERDKVAAEAANWLRSGPFASLI